MPKNIILGFLLIGIGLIAFNCQSSPFKTFDKEIHPNLTQSPIKKSKTIPLPRLAGIIALSGGIFLIFMNKPIKV